MHRFGGMPGGPLVVFAHINQDGFGVGGQAGAGFGHAKLRDALLCVVDEGEKSG